MLVKQCTEYRDKGKKDNEGDGEVKNETLDTPARLEYGPCATAAEGTPQACATYLEQDENDDGDAQDELYYTDCWKPLSQNIFLTFVLTDELAVFCCFPGNYTIGWKKRREVGKNGFSGKRSRKVRC